MSIGDLFGDDLKALFADEAEDDGTGRGPAQSPGERISATGESSRSNPDGKPPSEERPVPTEFSDVAQARQSEAEVVVRAIVGELSHTPPEALDLNRPLQELGIEGLGLWAVVSDVERQTGRSIKDQEALAWRTPAHVVAAAEAA